MNAALLLEHYEQIADAPDAIARLRRFILDLAVRGKLVEQDPNDEPASELLKRIAAEKAGQQKGNAELRLDDQSDGISPRGWTLVPLRNVVIQHQGGGTPSKANSAFWDGDIRWASVKDVGKSKFLDDTIDRITPEGLANSSSNLIEPGNLIVVTRMGLGKVSINRVEVAINQDLRALRFSSGVNVDYAYNFFLTHSFEGTGLTVKGIKVEELLRFPFPLPPLAEQHRIVSKVDELMALCDQLEAAQAERETGRDKLTLSTLAKLNEPDPETFADDASFALEHLEPLTKRTDQIKQLRQTILNLAVRGKLVEQDPNDEPAASLVDRLDQQKRELIAAGTLKKDKRLSDIPADNEPFAIPLSWTWQPLDRLAHKITDGEHISPNKTSAGMPLLTAVHVSARGLTLQDPQFVSEEDGWKFRQRCDPKRGDILICSRGTIGRCVIVDVDEVFCLMGSVIQIRLPSEISSEYAFRFLSTDFAQRKMRGMSGATAVSALYLKDIRLCPVPVPPLAEQHRIVAKVDELMALCDQLEASLIESEHTCSKLLEAVLHEALEPV